MPIFSQIGAELASQYIVSYRSLLPPKDEATVKATVAGLARPRCVYTTPTHQPLPAGIVPRELDGQGDHVAVADGLRRRRGPRSPRIRGARSASMRGKRSLPRRMATVHLGPARRTSRRRRPRRGRRSLADGRRSASRATAGGSDFESDVELGGCDQSRSDSLGWTARSAASSCRSSARSPCSRSSVSSSA